MGTKKWWLHTATSELYTYLFASPTRGKAAPDEAGVLGQFRGVMVHDRLSMYFNYDKADHAICGSHVLRELAANPAPVGRQRDYLERKSHNLVAALEKLKTEATRFATDLSVPMTNNAAERSLRMAKIHHKVSSCFQSEEGARAFATVRSYLATARQHGVGGLDVLAQLFRGEAWMPPPRTT